MKHVHKAINFLQKLSDVNKQQPPGTVEHDSEEHQFSGSGEDTTTKQKVDLKRWNPPDSVPDVLEMDTFTRHDDIKKGIVDNDIDDERTNGNGQPSSKYMDPIVSRLLQGMRPLPRSTREVVAHEDEDDPIVSRILQGMKSRPSNPTFSDYDFDVEGSSSIGEDYDLNVGVINIDDNLEEDLDDLEDIPANNAWEDYQLEYNYLDDLLYGFDDAAKDFDDDQDRSEDSEVDTNDIEFRDFPLEDGYVRIPIKYPGLNITKVEAPNPKLWTAEEAFIDQVIPSLYMFIPAALLGFIIGMAVWLVVLIILRTYSSLRKSIEEGKEEPQKDIINDIKYSLSDDPWKKISDAETVHGVDGSMRKGDRVWNLRKESGGRQIIGGSDRKPRRSMNHHDVSSLSAGKDMKF